MLVRRLKISSDVKIKVMRDVVLGEWFQLEGHGSPRRQTVYKEQLLCTISIDTMISQVGNRETEAMQVFVVIVHFLL